MAALGWLAAEAFSDALRRRIVPVICVFALLSLMLVDSCTGCAPVVRGADGEVVPVQELAGFGGMLMIVLLSAWTVILAGVLASDHLAEPLADGSASLLLARPVSRGSYALARLFGAWGLAAITGAGLLGAAAVLLELRQGLPGVPVLAALCAVLLNALTAAGIAMALSLALGRTLTALVVFAGVWGLAGLELMRFASIDLGPVSRAVAELAPPFVAGVVVPLRVWLGTAVDIPGAPIAVLLRALVWALASAGLLVLAFRRTELGR
jgi:hypothetical protein